MIVKQQWYGFSRSSNIQKVVFRQHLQKSKKAVKSHHRIEVNEQLSHEEV